MILKNETNWANNKSSSLKALKTESAESERNSERKKGAEKGFFTFTNSNDAKCIVCDSLWHMKNKYWVKNSAQASEKWREENESKIDKYKQKSKNSNTLNTSERKKKKSINDIVAKMNKVSLYRDHAWYINTVTSYHMTFNASLFNMIKPSNKEAELADRTQIKAISVETITLSILVNSELLEQSLHEVYHMLKLNYNLLSVRYLEKKGFLFEAFNERMWIREEKKIRLKATQVNTLYVLNQSLNLQVIMVKKNTHDIFTWHQWLAHLNKKNMHWLASMLTEITSLKGHIKNCEVCTLNKAHCQPSYCKFTKATKSFEWVHTDLRGSESTLTMSVDWNKYYVLYTDNCTQFRWLNMLRTKNKALESFWKFNSMVKTQFNTEIWRFQTDQSEEFKSNKIEKYLTKKEILWELTVLYAHEQNETAEQGNQII